MSLAYVDTSALVKLVRREPESPALVRSLEQWPDRVSNVIARVELIRAVRRAGGAGSLLARADDVLRFLSLIQLDGSIIESAGKVASLNLRTLDALHLATAEWLADDLGVLITYDRRLADAARARSLNVYQPL